MEKVCIESHQVVQQFQFNIYELVFLANLLCFLRMGGYQPLEDPESFKQCIEETERLFFMYYSSSSFQPEMAANRWREILSVANAVIDLTDEPVRSPVSQLFYQSPPVDSIFLEGFSKANMFT